MKKALLCVLVFFFMVTAVFAMGGPAPVRRAAYPYLIDNFEDGNYNKDPEWYTFDGIIPSIVDNISFREGDLKVADNVGTYSLKLTGTAKDWYVGGIGVMLGIDATGYDLFNIDVYGNGDNSGKLKIELYESVTGKNDIEVGKDWKPLHDNLWTKEIDVNWTGWKHLSLPIKEFTNEGHGSNVWNPKLINGQGGLVKAQLISVATTQTGSVNYNVDNIELGISK
jgi:hypothetical protein